MTSVNARPASVVRAAMVAPVAMFVSYLPFSTTNGGLAVIAQATGAQSGVLAWAVDAFTVALTAAVLVGGVLSARIGARGTIRVGLLFGAAGSLAAGCAGATSWSVHVLQAGLGVAGVGGGLVMTASLALLATEIPAGPHRARSISVWAAANVAALGAGPFLAGAVASSAMPWTAPYLLIAAILSAVAALPVGRGHAERGPYAVARGRIDVAGLGLGIAGMVSVILAATTASTTGWSSPTVIVALLVGVGLVVGMVLVERRASVPVMPLVLFRSARFVVAGVTAAVALFTMIGVVFTLSITLGATGSSPMQVALLLALLFAGNIVGSLAAGILQSRIHAVRILATSSLVTALGLVLLIALPVVGVDGNVGWRLLVVGLGAGGTIAASTALAIQSAPALPAAAGTINNALRQFGAALGAAVAAATLSTSGLHGALVLMLATTLGAAVPAVVLALHRDRR